MDRWPVVAPLCLPTRQGGPHGKTESGGRVLAVNAGAHAQGRCHPTGRCAYRTFSHFLIFNKTALSLSLSLSIDFRHWNSGMKKLCRTKPAVMMTQSAGALKVTSQCALSFPTLLRGRRNFLQKGLFTWHLRLHPLASFLPVYFDVVEGEFKFESDRTHFCATGRAEVLRSISVRLVAQKFKSGAKEIMPRAAGGAAGGAADGAAGGAAGGVSGPYDDDDAGGGRGGRIKASDSKYFLPHPTWYLKSVSPRH